MEAQRYFTRGVLSMYEWRQALLIGVFAPKREVFSRRCHLLYKLARLLGLVVF